MRYEKIKSEEEWYEYVFREFLGGDPAYLALGVFARNAFILSEFEVPEEYPCVMTSWKPVNEGVASDGVTYGYLYNEDLVELMRLWD